MSIDDAFQKAKRHSGELLKEVFELIGPESRKDFMDGPRGAYAIVLADEALTATLGAVAASAKKRSKMRESLKTHLLDILLGTYLLGFKDGREVTCDNGGAPEPPRRRHRTPAA